MMDLVDQSHLHSVSEYILYISIDFDSHMHHTTRHVTTGHDMCRVRLCEHVQVALSLG